MQSCKSSKTLTREKYHKVVQNLDSLIQKMTRLWNVVRHWVTYLIYSANVKKEVTF